MILFFIIFTLFALVVSLIVSMNFVVKNSKVPASDLPRIIDTTLFLGDSYSFGVGASNSSRKWTSLVSDELETIEINIAIPGEGYVRRSRSCGIDKCPFYLESIMLAKSIDPNRVILSGGQNDLSYVSNNRRLLLNTIEKTMATLRETYPNAQLYIVGPTTPVEQLSSAIYLDEILEKEAVAKNIRYISLRSLWNELFDNMISDGLHVNDKGHELIANFVLNQIKNGK